MKRLVVVFFNEIAVCQQFLYRTTIGTIGDTESILNCLATQCKSVAVHVAAAIEIQSKSASCECGKGVHPFVFVYLHEILIASGLMNSDGFLIGI